MVLSRFQAAALTARYFPCCECCRTSSHKMGMNVTSNLDFRPGVEVHRALDSIHINFPLVRVCWLFE